VVIRVVAALPGVQAVLVPQEVAAVVLVVVAPEGTKAVDLTVQVEIRVEVQEGEVLEGG
jgi:hypothetical protein